MIGLMSGYISLGFIAFFFYPDVSAVFWLLGGAPNGSDGAFCVGEMAETASAKRSK